MTERMLHSVWSILPSTLTRKLSPEDNPDAEAGDNICSDLLSASQIRSSAKDGRRDVCPGRSSPCLSLFNYGERQ